MLLQPLEHPLERGAGLRQGCPSTHCFGPAAALGHRAPKGLLQPHVTWSPKGESCPFLCTLPSKHGGAWWPQQHKSQCLTSLGDSSQPRLSVWGFKEHLFLSGEARSPPGPLSLQATWVCRPWVADEDRPSSGLPTLPRLPRHAGTRGQVPSKGHQSYICLHLVDKRPGPKYAVCDNSYELSRYFLVKIITGFCSFSYCDYRVLRSCTAPPPYKQLLASFPTEAIGMGSHCLLPALLNLPVLPSCHGPAGQPRPDPHRLGDTGVQNNNSENSFFSQIEERMGFPMSPSPSENCISPGLQQHTEHNT